jgi:hypothetical protein
MEQHKLGKTYYLRAEICPFCDFLFGTPPGALKIGQIAKMKKRSEGIVLYC